MLYQAGLTDYLVLRAEALSPKLLLEARQTATYI